MTSHYSERDLRHTLRDIKERIIQGLEIGFFELRVVGTIAKKGKRKLQLSYSPTEQYTIDMEADDEEHNS